MGKDYFTADDLTLAQVRALSRVCRLECPVLEQCTREREKYRAAAPWEWAQFTGVWAGQAYAKGRPRREAQRRQW